MAREAHIDLIAVTDHQSFEHYGAIAQASCRPGRPLVVLPGIEITANEGCHLLAVFPKSYSEAQQHRFYGWLEIEGTGDTREASRKRTIDILRKVVDEEGGVIIVPHPFAPKIGFLDSSRKLSTREEALETGHIRLFQLSATHTDRVRYIGHDENGNWINRYVLASASASQVANSSYCLAPFNRSDVHSPDDINDGCSWFRMQELSVGGVKQVACEFKTRISSEQPPLPTQDCILGLAVRSGYCRQQTFYFNEALTALSVQTMLANRRFLIL